MFQLRSDDFVNCDYRWFLLGSDELINWLPLVFTRLGWIRKLWLPVVLARLGWIGKLWLPVVFARLGWVGKLWLLVVLARIRWFGELWLPVGLARLGCIGELWLPMVIAYLRWTFGADLEYKIEFYHMYPFILSLWLLASPSARGTWSNYNQYLIATGWLYLPPLVTSLGYSWS